MLRVITLGGLRLELDGNPITPHLSRKAGALVAYLAVSGRQHRREEIAELLWQERSQSQSMANLRVILSNLRKHLGDYLSIRRDSVSINMEAEIWLDVAKLVEGLNTHNPEDYLALYGGEFLEGIYLRKAADFEQRISHTREEICNNLVAALTQCVEKKLLTSDYPSAIQCARLILKMDPLGERAHYDLMVLLFLDDQRQAALKQFDEYCQLLQREWGVEPNQQALDLYEWIKAGDRHAVLQHIFGTAPSAPVYLDAEQSQREKDIFIAREAELERLDQFLDKVLTGSSGIVFVRGGPGRGKTSLVRQFAQLSIDKYADLLVAWSTCSTFQNMGDPLLVWRDALRMLVGDVERLWLAGTIRREHALRLWDGIPVTLQALTKEAPDVYPTLLRGVPLAQLCSAHSAVDDKLVEKVQSLEKRADMATFALQTLVDQYAQLLHSISTRQPLLIILDDLHWADRPSLNFLNQLIHRLGAAQVLLVGTYRPEELLRTSQNERHPLSKIVNEARRNFGDILVDLDQIDSIERRRFVDTFLDVAPNRISDDFRQAYYDRTQGDALFVVELRRDLEERGVLYQDQDKYWCIQAEPDWDRLPEKVLGVVEERIDRLSPDLKQILRVASLLGEQFPAELVAKILGIKKKQILYLLSQILQRQHRLVHEQSIESIGDIPIINFEFSHNMFRQFLLDEHGLGEGERVSLHKSIAGQMENLYEGNTDMVASNLAHHWLAARDERRAVEYLDKAGDQARARYALNDAEIYYSKAIAIRQAVGMDALAGETYLKLGLAKLAKFEWETADQAYEKGFALLREDQRSQSYSEEDSPCTFRLALAEPITLDPGLMKSEISTYYGTQLFEGLVTIDAEKNVLPGAADHWQISDLGRRYTFFLKENLRWSNGDELTAADFEFAIKRNLSPIRGDGKKTPFPNVDLLFPIKNAQAYHNGTVSADRIGIRALNDLTLEIELEKPTAYFLLLMALSVAYPLPKEVVEICGEHWTEAENFTCNGPFVMVSWNKGSSLLLTRNPYYHGFFPGNVDNVECIFFRENNSAIEAYAAGEIDAISLINASLKLRRYAYFKHKDQLLQFPDSKIWYALFRVDQEPFNDIHIRQAFRLSIDRQRLIKTGFRDGRRPAFGGFIPPNVPGHTADLTTQNMDKPHRIAKKRIKKGGYPDGIGFPNVECAFPRGGRSVVQLLLDMWEECLGVQVQPLELPYSQLIDQVDKDPAAITLLGWSEHYPDPYCFLIQFCAPNRPHWSNHEFEALITEAETIEDQGKRIAMYSRADQILVAEQAVVIPISYGVSGMVTNNWINLTNNALGMMRFKDIVIDKGAKTNNFKEVII